MTRTIVVDREVEVWKDIPDYPDYMICRDGRIWSKISNVFLKHTKRPHGYCVVGLMNQKRIQRQFYVHRLVITTFVGNPPKDELGRDYECNHIDGNKTNNTLDNLEWVSIVRNMQHAHDIGLFDKSNEIARKLGFENVGEKNHSAKLTDENAREILLLLNEGRTLKEVANKFKVTIHCIHKIKKRKNWRHITL